MDLNWLPTLLNICDRRALQRRTRVGEFALRHTRPCSQLADLLAKLLVHRAFRRSHSLLIEPPSRDVNLGNYVSYRNNLIGYSY